VVDSRWGLCWGLRRGLGSGLTVIVSGAFITLAEGSSPVRILALFAALSAKVSVSLQEQNKQINKLDPEFERQRRYRDAHSSSSSSRSGLNPEMSKSTFVAMSVWGGGGGVLGRLLVASAGGW
jgi:hypothetical protein